MLSREENYLVCKSTGVKSDWEQLRQLCVLMFQDTVNDSGHRAVFMAQWGVVRQCN
jgi:hypothetical protein